MKGDICLASVCWAFCAGSWEESVRFKVDSSFRAGKYCKGCKGLENVKEGVTRSVVDSGFMSNG